MRRVLVTGASGFVGKPLVNELARCGYAIRAAARNPQNLSFPGSVECVRLPDLAETIDWRPLLAGITDVVHLASATHAGPLLAEDKYDRITRGAVVQLARAASEARLSRLVFISSIRAQTGLSSRDVATELDEPRPTDAYGRSKLAAEAAVRSSGVPYTILRFVRVYGPGVQGNIAALLSLARSRWPLPFGSLASRRSLLALENAVSAIGFVLDRPETANETYLVADPNPATVGEVITWMRAGLGRSPGLVPVPPILLAIALRALGRANLWEPLGHSLMVDPAKLIAAGWEPPLSTAMGLGDLARSEARAARPTPPA